MSLSVAEPPDRIVQEKSATAFRTIKEAAEELDVPQHVLRFWETRFAQVRPVKRAGGRRYYRPDDIDLLKGIRGLLHGQGYTIKGAQGVLREKGVRFVQSLGRGEAEIAAPTSPDDPVSLEDRSPEDEAGLDGLSTEARALLEAALRDLHDCRAILTSLRPVRDSAGSGA